MKRNPQPLGVAIALFIFGMFFGSIFTFQTQYADVARNDCVEIQTHFLDYEEIHHHKKARTITHCIAIDCANGERYFIDLAYINSELRNSLTKLSTNQNINLLIYPDSNRIVEFSADTDNILVFNETMAKLVRRQLGERVLGIFMYLIGIVGLYHIVLNIMKKRGKKKPYQRKKAKK